jgi:hypothetical protein
MSNGNSAFPQFGPIPGGRGVVPVVGSGPQVPVIQMQFQITPEFQARLKDYASRVSLDGMTLVNLVMSLGLTALDSMLINEEKRSTDEEAPGETSGEPSGKSEVSGQ